eukprot:gene13436-biopygen11068
MVPWHPAPPPRRGAPPLKRGARASAWAAALAGSGAPCQGNVVPPGDNIDVSQTSMPPGSGLLRVAPDYSGLLRITPGYGLLRVTPCIPCFRYISVALCVHLLTFRIPVFPVLLRALAPSPQKLGSVSAARP